MQPPFPSGEIALRHSFHLLSNPELGLRGTLVGIVPGGGGETPQEMIGTAQMIVNLVRETIHDPYLAAIIGGMSVVNWSCQQAWSQRKEKFEALLKLGTWLDCPNSRYKAHALGAWSGLHHLDEDRWAAKIGVTTRTLRRWRLGDKGVWTVADAYLKIAVNMADREFREVGVVE